MYHSIHIVCGCHLSFHDVIDVQPLYSTGSFTKLPIYVCGVARRKVRYESTVLYFVPPVQLLYDTTSITVD